MENVVSTHKTNAEVSLPPPWLQQGQILGEDAEPWGAVDSDTPELSLGLLASSCWGSCSPKASEDLFQIFASSFPEPLPNSGSSQCCGMKPLSATLPESGLPWAVLRPLTLFQTHNFLCHQNPSACTPVSCSQASYGITDRDPSYPEERAGNNAIMAEIPFKIA